jgi:hypothetical protein
MALIGEWTNTLETSYGASWTTTSKSGALALEIKAPATTTVRGPRATVIGQAVNRSAVM